MSLSISNSDKKNIPTAFVGFFALFLITEIFVYVFFSVYFTNPTFLRMKQKTILAGDENKVADIVILGDSSSGLAFDVSSLEKMTGKTVLKLSLFGNATIAGNYMMLKEYVKTKPPPKYLLVMNVYDVWTRGLHEDAPFKIFWRNYPSMFFDPGLLKIMPLYMVNEKLILYKICNSILPSFTFHHEIKRFLGDMRSFVDKSKEAANRIKKQVDEDLVLKSDRKSLPERIHKDRLSHEIKTRGKEFNVSMWNKYYSDKLFQLAKEHNIKIYICPPPLYDDYYYKNVNPMFFKDYMIFLRSLKNPQDNIFLLYDELYIVDESKLWNSIDHLNTSESVIFTEYIAGKLAEYEGETFI